MLIVQVYGGPAATPSTPSDTAPQGVSRRRPARRPANREVHPRPSARGYWWRSATIGSTRAARRAGRRHAAIATPPSSAATASWVTGSVGGVATSKLSNSLPIVSAPQAEHPGQSGEQEALDEQLPRFGLVLRPATPACLILARPARGPRQEQIGAVRAGDEQHDAGGGQQRRQGRSEHPVVVLVEGIDPRPQTLAGFGVGRRESTRMTRPSTSGSAP